jgi:orotate phosphoribosyltransferase
VIIEDVTTAGTSIRETLPIIKAQADAKVLGLVVSVDRCERGTGTKSALDEIRESFGIETTAIVTMKEVTEYLSGSVIDDEMLAKIDAYYQLYGVQ